MGMKWEQAELGIFDMKKKAHFCAAVISMFFLICLLIFNPSFAYQDIGVFDGIPFGTELDKVYENLSSKNYEIKRAGEDDLQIDHFKIGQYEFKVQIHFDHNKRFYSHWIFSEAFSAEHYKAELFDNAVFISRLFKEKAGKPRKCH
jgi:hypothetical protein